MCCSRTAYSEAVREARDFSVGLFDRNARMIVQGDFSPGHLGSMPSAVKNFLEYYSVEDLRPGDCLILNDLYMGSGHLPDFFMMSPCFAGGEIVGFAVNCVHMIDVGGAAPGSQQVEGINDHYQEGLRLWPTRLWREGEVNPEILKIIEANVRIPDKLIGDLLAMRNCNRILERRLAALVDKYGLELYREAGEEILKRSEAAMRADIAAMPDGTYRAVDFFDDYGPGTDPLRIEVAVTVAGDELTIDFTGSSPQTKSSINAVLTYVRAFCFYTVKCITSGAAIPQNDGCLVPIMFVAEPGSRRQLAASRRRRSARDHAAAVRRRADAGVLGRRPGPRDGRQLALGESQPRWDRSTLEKAVRVLRHHHRGLRRPAAQRRSRGRAERVQHRRHSGRGQ